MFKGVSGMTTSIKRIITLDVLNLFICMILFVTALIGVEGLIRTFAKWTSNEQVTSYNWGSENA